MTLKPEILIYADGRQIDKIKLFYSYDLQPQEIARDLKSNQVENLGRAFLNSNPETLLNITTLHEDGSTELKVSQRKQDLVFTGKLQLLYPEIECITRQKLLAQQNTSFSNDFKDICTTKRGGTTTLLDPNERAL